MLTDTRYRTHSPDRLMERLRSVLLSWAHVLFQVLRVADAGEDAGPNALRASVSQKAEALLRDHGDSVLRLAYSYLHNMADAEEILQETLIQYLKTAPVLENAAHEKAWLFRVAGNLCKNRISYNKVRSTDELNEALIAEERQDLSFVWEAVRDLPVKYREAIHLFYYEGLSTAQIAQVLGQKESTVRSRLMRGRARLRSILKEGYDFEGGI